MRSLPLSVTLGIVGFVSFAIVSHYACKYAVKYIVYQTQHINDAGDRKIEESMKKRIADNPGKSGPVLNYASWLFTYKRYEEAKQQLIPLTHQDKPGLCAMSYMARISQIQHDPDAAQQWWLKIIKQTEGRTDKISVSWREEALKARKGYQKAWISDSVRREDQAPAQPL